MARLICIFITLLSSSASHIVQAELSFPQLSGRIVDKAGILSAVSENKLTELLGEHERSTDNQIVVVTLKTLQGFTIEEYGYQVIL